MNDVDRESRLQRYLDGELDAGQRACFEDEVLASDARATELMDELALRELIEARRKRTRSLRRLRQMGLASVLVAAASVVILMRSPPDAPPTLRGDRTVSIAIVSPEGDLPARPQRFVWRAQLGAVRYRVELFDASARRVASVVVADTIWAPPEPELVPDRGYWQVTPLDASGIPSATSRPVHYGVVP